MKLELNSVSDQGQRLIKRFGSLRNFLLQDDNIVLVDDYICLQEDIATARSLALSNVLQNTDLNGVGNQEPNSVWNTKTPPPPKNMDDYLTLPKVDTDSLFDYKIIKPPAVTSTATKVTIPSSFPVPPPPLQSGAATPPPLLKPYSSMVASVPADLESLTKNLSVLNNTNADLMKQVDYELFYMKNTFLRNPIIVKINLEFFS